MNYNHPLVKLVDKIENSLLPLKIKRVFKSALSFSDWNTGENIKASQSTMANSASVSLRTAKYALKIINNSQLLIKTSHYNHNSRRPQADTYKANVKLLEYLVKESEQIRYERQMKLEQRNKVKKLVRELSIQESMEQLKIHKKSPVDKVGAWCKNGKSMVQKRHDHGAHVVYNHSLPINNLNTVGKRKAVDNFVNMEVAKEHTMNENFVPCDELAHSKPTNPELAELLKTFLIEKEGSPQFMEAERAISRYKTYEYALAA